MNEMEVPDSILIVTRNLIIHYLQRRRETVVEILLETRPQAFAALELEGIEHKIDLKPYFTRFVEHPAEVPFQQRGIWRDEWEWYFHGAGCRLTHLHTGECFDWDVDNPAYFHESAFFNHLDWRRDHQNDYQNVRYFIRWYEQNREIKVFAIMEQRQMIQQIPQNWTPPRWELLK